MDSTSKKNRVITEFTGQAGAMNDAVFFNNTDSIEKILGRAGLDGGSAALDLCCGPGIVTVELAKRAGRVHALDLTPAMIEKARLKARTAGMDNIGFVVGDAGATGFEEGSFDVVVTRLSLHHFEDPAAVVKEAWRVLKPGGRFIIADLVSAAAGAAAELHNALETIRDSSHVRILSAKEFYMLAEGQRFSVMEAECWKSEREFTEWAEIINDPARTGPLRVVMKNLALNQIDCGIDLSFDNGKLSFNHSWILLVLRK